MTFEDKIRKIAFKEKFTKIDLLIDDLLLLDDNGIKIYYAPFDQINKDAKIILVGITPGWTQMQKSYETTISMLNNNHNWASALAEVKKKASFAGPMRLNLVKMLNESA